MNARERVRKTIRHEEPDRVPIDFGGSLATGIHVDAYAELGEKLGLDVGLPKVYEPNQFLARAEEPLRSRFRTDTILLENICDFFELENRDWKQWETNRGHKVLVPGAFNPVVDEQGYLHLLGASGKTLGLMPKGGLYFERFNDPSGARIYDDPMPPEEWAQKIPLYTDEHLKQIQTVAKWMHDYTPYAVIGGFGKLKMTSTTIFAGHIFTDWMMRLMLEPDYVFEVLSAACDRTIENLKLYLEAVGEYIDVIFMSTTDYGAQDRELFSPDVFRDLFVPNIRKVNDYAHAHSDAKTLFHSCGSISHIIGYMVDAGVDLLNPIQSNAAHMDPLTLKKEFGDRLVFWGGGMDTQRALPEGTPESVRALVKERMKILKPGGGFVFAAEHNIQVGVPPENIIAMYDEAYESGVYEGSRQD